MPYKCNGNKLMHKKGGEWSVKQVCGSHAACLKAAGLLYAIDKNPDYIKEHPMKK